MSRGRRQILPIPRLRPGEGRECTLPATLAVASGAGYDDLMGASGAAFTAAIDAETWDPLAAAPLDDATLARAAWAAGVRVDRVTPPFDEEMRELVFERVVEAVEAKLPPLIKGAVGPAEFGLIVGYELARTRPGAELTGEDERRSEERSDYEDAVILVRTYFDRGEEPTRIGLDALAGEGRGEPYFLDRAERPPREALAREGIARATEAATSTEAALRAWLAALRDEARWAPARPQGAQDLTERGPTHGGAWAFADHTMRTLLADKRRAAARFLRSVRDVFPSRAGAELLRAAEAYGKVADAAERAGVGAFDPAVAMRFVEGGHRRAWAKGLEGAIAHEAEAHDALRAAHLLLAGGSAPHTPR